MEEEEEVYRIVQPLTLVICNRKHMRSKSLCDVCCEGNTVLSHYSDIYIYIVT